MRLRYPARRNRTSQSLWLMSCLIYSWIRFASTDLCSSATGVSSMFTCTSAIVHQPGWRWCVRKLGDASAESVMSWAASPPPSVRPAARMARIAEAAAKMGIRSSAVRTEGRVPTARIV